MQAPLKKETFTQKLWKIEVVFITENIILAAEIHHPVEAKGVFEGMELYSACIICLSKWVCFLHICLGDSGVWGLKKNFALLELLERLQNGATNQSGMAEDALKGMGEVRQLWFYW